MSDWEDMCENLGIANDENALDTLLDRFSGGDEEPYRWSHKRADETRAKLLQEARKKLLATPIGQYIASRWSLAAITRIDDFDGIEGEEKWRKLECVFGEDKSGETSYCLTIRRVGDDSCEVTFSAHSHLNECTWVTKSANRLTKRILDETITECMFEFNCSQFDTQPIPF